LNYLILSNPISGLFPESYSYHVYIQYDMIWHANAGISRICWSIYRMHMTGQIKSLIMFGQKTPQFRFILKTFYFRFGFLILKKGNQILGNRTWECSWGSRSRSTPEVEHRPRGRRPRTSGQEWPRTPRVDPSQLYHLWLI
jgi:hypothetical protein